MTWARWPTCLWPGLPQLWLRGSWSGVALAVGFAWFVSLVLATTFVWTEWIGPAPRNLAWIMLVVLWLASATANLRWLRAQKSLENVPPNQDLFPAALNEYLQGNWYAAERGCLDLLARHDRDAEALLLLCTLYRHTGQFAQARQRLAQLERLDGAARWHVEIENEKTRLAERERSCKKPDEASGSSELELDRPELVSGVRASGERVFEELAARELDARELGIKEADSPEGELEEIVIETETDADPQADAAKAA